MTQRDIVMGGDPSVPAPQGTIANATKIVYVIEVGGVYFKAIRDGFVEWSEVGGVYFKVIRDGFVEWSATKEGAAHYPSRMAAVGGVAYNMIRGARIEPHVGVA